jgi:hypothetical protein|tara:strand:+ start:269 stop:454 length:186 start_codon:yes stop_codon:yes gene_type:complete
MVKSADQAEEETVNKATAYTVADNFRIMFCLLSNKGMATLSIQEVYKKLDGSKQIGQVKVN